MTEKRWAKEDIRKLLEESDAAVMKGLVVLYRLQTKDEQSAEITRYRNGVGFNAQDANFLSSLAKQVLKRGKLSRRQLDTGRRRILKYSNQLARVANGEIIVPEGAEERV